MPWSYTFIHSPAGERICDKRAKLIWIAERKFPQFVFGKTTTALAINLIEHLIPDRFHSIAFGVDQSSRF